MLLVLLTYVQFLLLQLGTCKCLNSNFTVLYNVWIYGSIIPLMIQLWTTYFLLDKEDWLTLSSQKHILAWKRREHPAEAGHCSAGQHLLHIKLPWRGRFARIEIFWNGGIITLWHVGYLMDWMSLRRKAGRKSIVNAWLIGTWAGLQSVWPIWTLRSEHRDARWW